MKFNISLAGWILSLATFISGSVLYPLYLHLSFDGFSVQQTSMVRSVSQDPAQPIVHFSTLLKVANARKYAVLIEELKAPDKIKVPGFCFVPYYTEFKFFTPNETIALPPSGPIIEVLPGRGAVLLSDLQRESAGTTGPTPTAAPVLPDLPPLLVKSGEEKLLGVTIYFSFTSSEPGKVNEAHQALYNHIMSEGLPIRLGINGEYRRFKLQILPTRTTPPRP